MYHISLIAGKSMWTGWLSAYSNLLELLGCILLEFIYIKNGSTNGPIIVWWNIDIASGICLKKAQW